MSPPARRLRMGGQRVVPAPPLFHTTPDPMHRLIALAVLAALLAAPPADAQPSPAPSAIELLGSPPGSTYWSNGKFFFFQTFSFAFLPGSDGYNSYGDGPRFELRYLDAGGAEVSRKALDSRPVGNGPFQNVTDVEGIDLNAHGAGDYTAEWLVGGDPVYRFPFSVTEITSDDPYASGSKWAVDGMWGDYLVVKTPRPGVVGPVSLLFFDREVGYERDRSTERGFLVLVERDGAPVWRAPANDWYHDKGPDYDENSGIGGVTYEVAPWWELREVTPVSYWPEADVDPSNETHRGLPIESLDDGTYTVTLEAFAHGDVEGDARLSVIRDAVTVRRTASFEVADGAIVPQGRQAPGADPLTRIEGGHADLTHHFHFVPWAE